MKSLLGKLGVLSIGLLILGYAEVWGADWKVFGGSVLSKDKTTIGYYDAESIEYLSNGNVTVWTKTVKTLEVEMIGSKKEVIEKAAEKLVQGYHPPYVLLNPYPKTSLDSNLDIIMWEEAANHDIKPRLRVLFEINCEEKMIRTLSTIIYKKDGTGTSRSINGTWDYISPEINTETLRKILCKDKK
ncbi:MAG: surface-adhesin E family protein [Thermodesulfobacteriota bacterium]|jgi:hypothetical protein